MPETTSNGYSNGNNIHNGYEMEDDASFLFTSESVGEGHPGKLPKTRETILRLFRGWWKIPSLREGRRKQIVEANVRKFVVIHDSW